MEEFYSFTYHLPCLSCELGFQWWLEYFQLHLKAAGEEGISSLEVTICYEMFHVCKRLVHDTTLFNKMHKLTVALHWTSIYFFLMSAVLSIHTHGFEWLELLEITCLKCVLIFYHHWMWLFYAGINGKKTGMTNVTATQSTVYKKHCKDCSWSR